VTRRVRLPTIALPAGKPSHIEQPFELENPATRFKAKFDA
jgi:hypothetical protein